MIERYTLPEMGSLFTDSRRYQRWLEVELACCEVLARENLIPPEAMEAIRARAGFDPAEIDTIEAEVHHDVVAFVTCVARRVGPEGRFIHKGLTSSDVVDTALSLTLRDALSILLDRVDALRRVVAELARKHAHTVMAGRTHGVHAEPTTLGMKLAVWCQELRRHRTRLEAARTEVGVGKISGAVGNYSSLSPALEAMILTRLGLAAAPVSSQILQRDRHAAVMTTLACVAASVEKFALEVRGLARSEVGEVQEPFEHGQAGSSAMPHKRNPVLCERLCGLARLMRGYAVTALENVALWHERDISHSSAERVVFPDAFITLHYMLCTLTAVVSRLTIHPERMRANLDRSGGVVFSGKVLQALVEAGMVREEAYRLVQRHAMTAMEPGAPGFLDLLGADPRVTRQLTPDQLAACFDPAPFLRH
ncbi:MAG: adenylosuccinate lyase, partial [Candidatus Riflebacteria bacterium]|nr:adenylosuccinate lyase [Candidatus Riflebacteria bacterium]